MDSERHNETPDFAMYRFLVSVLDSFEIVVLIKCKLGDSLVTTD